VAYTPAWAQKVTGVKAADIERTGREFADNAAKTKGKSMVIMGAAINHWYHHDQSYRSIMNLLHMCGCVGQSGGGWAHYVGQEKLRPQAGWAPIAFGLDWHRPPRHMNSTSYWYFHTDQWRYETLKPDEMLTPAGKNRNKGYSLADYNVVSTRLGWLPSAPHFNRNPMELANEAAKAGATDEAGAAKYVAEQLKSGALDVAFADPGQPGELAAQPDRLARQPDRHLGQGPRVLPQAPAGRPERRAAGRRRRQRLQGGQVA
jgi:nitrate reductase alpha subunit